MGKIKLNKVKKNKAIQNGKHKIVVTSKSFYNKKTKKIEEMDNSLIKTKKGFKNKCSKFNIEFKDINKEDNNILTLAYEQYKVSMKLLGKIENNKNFINNSKFNLLTDHKVSIENVFEDSDIEFEIVNDNTIKENIVVKNNNKENYEYEYEMNIENLKIQLDEKQENILFINESNQTIFKMLSPIMIDSNNVKSENIEYEIIKNDESSYKLKIKADAKWINDKNRNLPIYLDPSFSIEVNETFNNTDSLFNLIFLSGSDSTEDSNLTSPIGDTFSQDGVYILSVKAPSQENTSIIEANTTTVKVKMEFTLNGSSNGEFIVSEYFGDPGVFEKDTDSLNPIHRVIKKFSTNQYSVEFEIRDSIVHKGIVNFYINPTEYSNVTLDNIKIESFYKLYSNEKKTIQLTDSLLYQYDYALKKYDLYLSLPGESLSCDLILNKVDYRNDIHSIQNTFGNVKLNFNSYIMKQGNQYYLFDGADNAITIIEKKIYKYTKRNNLSDETCEEEEDNNYYYLSNNNKVKVTVCEEDKIELYDGVTTKTFKYDQANYVINKIENHKTGEIITFENILFIYTITKTIGDSHEKIGVVYKPRTASIDRVVYEIDGEAVKEYQFCYSEINGYTKLTSIECLTTDEKYTLSYPSIDSLKIEDNNGLSFLITNDGRTIQRANKYDQISNESCTDSNANNKTIFDLDFKNHYELFITDEKGKKEYILLDDEGNTKNIINYRKYSSDNNIKIYPVVKYYNCETDNENTNVITGYSNIYSNNLILDYDDRPHYNLQAVTTEKINDRMVYGLPKNSATLISIPLSDIEDYINHYYIFGMFVKKPNDGELNIIIKKENDTENLASYSLSDKFENWQFVMVNKLLKFKAEDNDNINIIISYSYTTDEPASVYISFPVFKRSDNIIQTIDKPMEIDVTNFENPEDDSIERIYYKSHATCQKSRDIKTKYYFDELGRNISISKSGKAILTKNITYNEFEIATEYTTIEYPSRQLTISNIYTKNIDDDDYTYTQKTKITNNVNSLYLENIPVNITTKESFNKQQKTMIYESSTEKDLGNVINPRAINPDNNIEDLTPETQTYYLQTRSTYDEHLNVLTQTNELGEVYLTNTYENNLIKSMKYEGLDTKYFNYEKGNIKSITSSTIQTLIKNIFEYNKGLLTRISLNDTVNYLYTYNQDRLVKKIDIQYANSNTTSSLYSQSFNYKTNSEYNTNNFDDFNYYETSYGDYNVKEIYDKDDNLCLIKEKSANTEEYVPVATFEYYDNGSLWCITERINNEFYTIEYAYEYDDEVVSKMFVSGKVEFIVTYGQFDEETLSSCTTYSYDNDDVIFSYSYYYSPLDNNITKVINPLGTFELKRDEFVRVKEKDITLSDRLIQKIFYNYKINNTNATNIIESVNHKINVEGTTNYTLFNEAYEYDSKGNIINQTVFNQKTKYFYDKLNRLVREDNQALGVSKCYQYDNNNNITLIGTTDYIDDGSIMVATDATRFCYNSNCKLTKVKVNDTVYMELSGDYNLSPTLIRKTNQNGNIQEKQLTFSRFNTLMSYGDVSYQYDINGNRLVKQCGNTKHLYYIEGNRINREDIIDTQTYARKTIYYHYDANGIAGFVYQNNKYYYAKDLTGNIVGIYNSSSGLVAKYVYDAWGNHKVFNASGTENTQDSFIGNINPFRYKGYYYDVETQLFYCNSRYYSPELCRFISPDSIEYLDPQSINGLNLYAYCMNNPIMYYDPSGHIPEWLSDVGRFIGGLLITAASAALMVATIISGGLLCLVPGYGTFLQAELSLLMYGGFMMASSWDPLIQSDMEAINWNPFNSNPDMSKVNKVSFYKGEAVIIQDFARSSFSFGIIGLHKNDKHDIKTVNHEWGHFAQLTLFGPASFMLLFGIPSMLYNLYCQKTGDWSKYYKMPWEAFADYLGGVKR